MPAFFILFACATIGIAAWTTAWRVVRKVKSRRPRNHLQRLQRQAVWLELRLDTARQERWDRSVIMSLSDQLGATCEELARAQSQSFRNTTAAVQ